MPRKTLDIIYDGQCGFCLRSLNVLRAFDLRGVMRLHDSHCTETFERFPAMAGADVDEAMYVVVEGEPAYRGFYAFRRLMWGSPATWLLLPAFYFPGAAFCGTRIYAWVARHRSRLGCRSDVCALPAAAPPQSNSK